MTPLILVILMMEDMNPPPICCVPFSRRPRNATDRKKIEDTLTEYNSAQPSKS